MVGGLGAQAVGEGEVTIEVAHVERARERRQLVNDRLRLGLGDSPGHLPGIERVGDDRLGADRATRSGHQDSHRGRFSEEATPPADPTRPSGT